MTSTIATNNTVSIATREVRDHELLQRMIAKAWAIKGNEQEHDVSSNSSAVLALEECAVLGTVMMDVMKQVTELLTNAGASAIKLADLSSIISNSIKMVTVKQGNKVLDTSGVTVKEITKLLDKSGMLKTLAKKKVVVLGKGYTKMITPVAKGFLKPASEGVTDSNRRKKWIKEDRYNKSDLLMKTIKGQESVELVAIANEHEINMVRIVDTVYKRIEKTNKPLKQHLIKNQDSYALQAIKQMVAEGNEPVVAEYAPDARMRTYQVDTHGLNGQAGDAIRSMTGYANVTTNYNSGFAFMQLMNEMEDMVSGIKKDTPEFWAKVNEALTTPEDFIYDAVLAKAYVNKLQLNLKGFGKNNTTAQSSREERLKDMAKIKKPYSFVLFSYYLNELKNGNKPLIRCGFGLDATGSGPQLMALTVGDFALAAANGFAIGDEAFWEANKDAYERCVDSLIEAGFSKISRAGIKTAFMAIFYSQGWQAFTSVEAFNGQLKDILSDYLYQTTDGHHEELFEMLSENGKNLVEVGTNKKGEKKFEISEVVARRFHTIVKDSFGALLNTLTRAMKDSYSYFCKEEKTSKRKPELNGNTPVYHLPCGGQVHQTYKVEVGFAGLLLEKDVVEENKRKTLTVVINDQQTEVELDGLKITTNVVNYNNCGRTSTVNLTHAVDGVLARLIISNLMDLGVKNFTSVHDCFRVDIHALEAGHLTTAISSAYDQLFGTENKNEDGKNALLPMGTDFIGLYFKGVNASTGATFNHKLSQFHPMTGERFLISKAKMAGLSTGNFVKDVTSKLGVEGEYSTFFKK